MHVDRGETTHTSHTILNRKVGFMELEDLIRQIDIVEFIGQYVELTPKNDEFWGLSPFKDEKTPSFSVRREINQWYDFSSGQGGNIFHFIKKYFQCSNTEAVEIIKKYAGCTEDVVIGGFKLAATTVCKRFAPKKHEGKASAGVILPDDCMDKYEIRKDKLQVWENEGIGADSLKKYQVRYDPFSNRLVYPIRSVNGKVVNIGGRTLDPKYKEKGLRKYTYFYPWGQVNTIYGIYENREAIQEKHEVILFEGCKSVLIADTWGIHNTGAILTSHLSENQMKILAKLSVNVVFALDKDVEPWTIERLFKLKQYVNVSYLYDSQGLLDSKDAPVDKGKEVFMKLYETRRKIR